MTLFIRITAGQGSVASDSVGRPCHVAKGIGALWQASDLCSCFEVSHQLQAVLGILPTAYGHPIRFISPNIE